MSEKSHNLSLPSTIIDSDDDSLVLVDTLNDNSIVTSHPSKFLLNQIEIDAQHMKDLEEEWTYKYSLLSKYDFKIINERVVKNAINRRHNVRNRVKGEDTYEDSIIDDVEYFNDVFKDMGHLCTHPPDAQVLTFDSTVCGLCCQTIERLDSFINENPTSPNYGQSININDDVDVDVDINDVDSNDVLKTQRFKPRNVELEINDTTHSFSKPKEDNSINSKSRVVASFNDPMQDYNISGGGWLNTLKSYIDDEEDVYYYGDDEDIWGNMNFDIYGGIYRPFEQTEFFEGSPLDSIEKLKEYYTYRWLTKIQRKQYPHRQKWFWNRQAPKLAASWSSILDNFKNSKFINREFRKEELQDYRDRKRIIRQRQYRERLMAIEPPGFEEPRRRRPRRPPKPGKQEIQDISDLEEMEEEDIADLEEQKREIDNTKREMLKDPRYKQLRGASFNWPRNIVLALHRTYNPYKRFYKVVRNNGILYLLDTTTGRDITAKLKYITVKKFAQLYKYKIEELKDDEDEGMELDDFDLADMIGAPPDEIEEEEEEKEVDEEGDTISILNDPLYKLLKGAPNIWPRGVVLTLEDKYHMVKGLLRVVRRNGVLYLLDRDTGDDVTPHLKYINLRKFIRLYGYEIEDEDEEETKEEEDLSILEGYRIPFDFNILRDPKYKELRGFFQNWPAVTIRRLRHKYHEDRHLIHASRTRGHLHIYSIFYKDGVGSIKILNSFLRNITVQNFIKLYQIPIEEIDVNRISHTIVTNKITREGKGIFVIDFTIPCTPDLHLPYINPESVVYLFHEYMVSFFNNHPEILTFVPVEQCMMQLMFEKAQSIRPNNAPPFWRTHYANVALDPLVQANFLAAFRELWRSVMIKIKEEEYDKATYCFIGIRLEVITSRLPLGFLGQGLGPLMKLRNLAKYKSLRKPKGTDILNKLESLILNKPNQDKRGGMARKNIDSRKLKRIKIGNGYKIYDVKSSGNNCGPRCLIVEGNLDGRKFNLINLRKQWGLSKTSKLSFNELELFANHFNLSFKIYEHGTHGQLICTHTFECINSTDQQHLNPIINLYFSNSHFSVIRFENIKKRCQRCSQLRLDMKNHVCNPKNKRWTFNMKSDYTTTMDLQPSKIELENLCMYDIETFLVKRPDGMNIQESYAIAAKFINEKLYLAYGKGCLRLIIDIIQQRPGSVFIAHNSAKFDAWLLIKELSKYDTIEMDPKTLIINNNRLLGLRFRDNSIKSSKWSKIWDTHLFLSWSLRFIAKKFGLSIQKGDFDHNLIQSWSDVETFKEGPNGWATYLEKDVLVLEQIVLKLWEVGIEMKINMFDYLTVSSMTFAKWKSLLSGSQSMENPKGEIKDFIREGIYGGRCKPFKNKFYIKHKCMLNRCLSILRRSLKGEKISNIDTKFIQHVYRECYKNNDYLFNADVNSLYPTAMKNFKFPIGPSRWSINPEYDFKKGLHGFYRIKYFPNPNLHWSILPRRVENPKELERKGLNWNLLDGTGVYTRIDIEEALKYGYTIIFIGEAIVFDYSDYVFREYIDYLYKGKQDQDKLKYTNPKQYNPVLRQFYKILMNSLYGKTIQRDINEQVKIVESAGSEYFKLTRERHIIDIRHLLNDKSVVIVQDKGKGFKPIQIGAYVLAYSRRLMNTYYFESNGLLTYTDTDSLHVYGEIHKKFMEKEFMGSGLGQLSNDIDSGEAKDAIIIHEISNGPKNYMYVFIGSDGKIGYEMKCKGIPKSKLKLDIPICNESKEHQFITYETYLNRLTTEIGIFNIAKKDPDTFDLMNIEMRRSINKTEWNYYKPYERSIVPKGIFWKPPGFNSSEKSKRVGKIVTNPSNKYAIEFNRIKDNCYRINGEIICSGTIDGIHEYFYSDVPILLRCISKDIKYTFDKNKFCNMPRSKFCKVVNFKKNNIYEYCCENDLVKFYIDWKDNELYNCKEMVNSIIYCIECVSNECIDKNIIKVLYNEETKCYRLIYSRWIFHNCASMKTFINKIVDVARLNNRLNGDSNKNVINTRLYAIKQQLEILGNGYQPINSDKQIISDVAPLMYLIGIHDYGQIEISKFSELNFGIRKNKIKKWKPKKIDSINIDIDDDIKIDIDINGCQ